MINWLFYNVGLWTLSHCISDKPSFTQRFLLSIVTLGLCIDAIWFIAVILNAIQNPTHFAIPVQIVK